MNLLSFLRFSNPAIDGNVVDRKARLATPFNERIFSRRHRGLLGKSSLELLVAMAMLGMSLLLAVPNLMPLLRGSNDRHNADALAFFVDDMRVKSGVENVDVFFHDGVKNVLAFESNWSFLHRRYPKLLKEVVQLEVKVVVPFSFRDGRLQSRKEFGRLVIVGKESRRIVDVTASGELCVGRAQTDEDLQNRGPCTTGTAPTARGCEQSGGTSLYAFWLSLCVIFCRPSRRRVPKETPESPKERSRINYFSARKKPKGYVLIEAVMAALLLTLCVGLVYSYAVRSRRENGLSAGAIARAHRASKATSLLKKVLHHLPGKLKEGVQPIKGQKDMLRTIKVLQRREGLVLLQIAVVWSSADARGASVHLWLKASRMADLVSAEKGTTPHDDEKSRTDSAVKPSNTPSKNGGTQ
ncbi:MAG: type II secretion system protein [Deltaproteobacteria bacterium]|nr:type II secretion system protein [Deltaproteobacteria bacterium]